MFRKPERQESSGDLGANEADVFDVAVDDELKSYKKQKTNGGSGGSSKASSSREASRAPSKKRQHKDEKFGFGGKKRHSKSGDAVSSGDLSAFAGSRGKTFGGGGVNKKVGKPLRLGKSRRKAQASKR